MKRPISAKEYKRLARLKRESEEMEAIAYKHDLDENFAVAGEKLNTRFIAATNEINRLKKNLK